jgi:hypothetical protein
MAPFYRATRAVAVPLATGDGVNFYASTFPYEKRYLVEGQSIDWSTVALGYQADPDLFVLVTEEDALAGDEEVAAALVEERRGNLGDGEGIVSFGGWFWRESPAATEAFEGADPSSPNDLKGTPWTS